MISGILLLPVLHRPTAVSLSQNSIMGHTWRDLEAYMAALGSPFLLLWMSF